MSGRVPVWFLWSWSTETPSDASIEFSVQTAASKAGLAQAPSTPLLFSSSPGPSQLAGTPAVARRSDPDTQTGAAILDETLRDAGIARNLPFARVTARLIPTSDKFAAPVLKTWNLQAMSIRPVRSPAKTASIQIRLAVAYVRGPDYEIRRPRMTTRHEACTEPPSPQNPLFASDTGLAQTRAATCALQPGLIVRRP